MLSRPAVDGPDVFAASAAKAPTDRPSHADSLCAPAHNTTRAVARPRARGCRSASGSAGPQPGPGAREEAGQSARARPAPPWLSCSGVPERNEAAIIHRGQKATIWRVCCSCYGAGHSLLLPFKGTGAGASAQDARRGLGRTRGQPLQRGHNQSLDLGLTSVPA